MSLSSLKIMKNPSITEYSDNYVESIKDQSTGRSL